MILGLGLAPDVGGPNLPAGYDPSTGTVADWNTTGATDIPTNPVVDSQLLTYCEGRGGVMDSNTGQCIVTKTVTPTNWVPIIAIGGGLLLMVALLGGRRR